MNVMLECYQIPSGPECSIWCLKVHVFCLKQKIDQLYILCFTVKNVSLSAM